MYAAAARAAPAGAQGILYIRAGGLQSRRQAEEDSGGQGNKQRKRKDGGVDVYGIGAREAGGPWRGQAAGSRRWRRRSAAPGRPRPAGPKAGAGWGPRSRGIAESPAPASPPAYRDARGQAAR